MKVRELTDGSASVLAGRDVELEFLVQRFNGKRHQGRVAHGISDSSGLGYNERFPIPGNFLVGLGLAPRTILVERIGLTRSRSSRTCTYRNRRNELNQGVRICSSENGLSILWRKACSCQSCLL